MDATRFVALLVVAFFSFAPADAVTMPTVPIGNAGNPADPRYGGFGSVDYDYRIGTTEVTNVQYTEFLNAVAGSDPYQLYNPFMGSESWGGIVRSGTPGSFSYAVKPDAIGQGPGGSNYTYADKPVMIVSWYSSIRFANWLHNDQGNDDTEDGAYTLLGGTPTPSNSNSITRNPGARWWLPSEDEWYKAAYHKNDGVTGNYFDYPTGTDSVPNNNLPSNDTGNSANFWEGNYTTGHSSHPMTDAGAYTLSASLYGTFDQGGNVWEWNEALINGSYRGLRGGSWNYFSSHLHPSFRFLDLFPGFGFRDIGFRVAGIPEPDDIGDYNHDSVVDAADYVVWRKTGINGPNGYDTWRTNFGEPGGSGSGAGVNTTIPEPATLIMLLAGTLVMLSRKRVRVS